MARKSDSTIYFDSCIYLAHYRCEVASYGALRIGAIKEMMKDNEKGGQTIATSSLTITEVISRLMSDEGFDRRQEIEDFKNKFKFGLHTAIDLDPQIAERAANYRNYYIKNPVKTPFRDQPYGNLMVPDAIQLATATITNCDEFWTFDGLNEGSDRYKSLKPLWLKNKVGGDNLIIVAPSLPQGRLPGI